VSLEAELLQFTDAGLDPLGHHIGDDHRRSRFAKRSGAGGANSLARSRNYRNLAIKLQFFKIHCPDPLKSTHPLPAIHIESLRHNIVALR
jgi:hypothetical protein